MRVLRYIRNVLIVLSCVVGPAIFWIWFSHAINWSVNQEWVASVITPLSLVFGFEVGARLQGQNFFWGYFSTTLRDKLVFICAAISAFVIVIWPAQQKIDLAIVYLVCDLVGAGLFVSILYFGGTKTLRSGFSSARGFKELFQKEA